MAWLTTTPWIRTSRWAAAALALSSCALDSAGVAPNEGTTSAGGSTSATTTSGPGSTGPTTSSSSGDGGTTSATGGAGPSSGGGGAGDGGSAGAGGAGGAGGDPGPEEWIKLLAGVDHQTIQDIALSPDGVSAYVVGIVREDVPTFDGQPLPDPTGDDIFVAKVLLDGSAVPWARTFGGSGDDQGRSVAVGLDAGGIERLYVGGLAKGRVAAENDLFAPGLEFAAHDDFGWVIELAPATGIPSGGVPWSPVQTEDSVDLAVMPNGGAIAVSTCRGGCTDDLLASSLGSDVILVGNNPVANTWGRRLIPSLGEQFGRAIGPHPSANAFLLVGEFDAVGFDARLPGTIESCPLVSQGDSDVFAAFFALQGGDYRCTGARGLGGPGRDEGRSAVRDDAFGYVSVHTSQPGPLGATPGPYVAKVSPGADPWSTNVDGSFPESQVFSLAVAGGRISVSGRRSDRGFLQLLDAQTGALGAARALTGSDPSAINAHARSGDVWLMGGRYRGAADFGGDLLGQPAPLDGNADGFVARIAPPM